MNVVCQVIELLNSAQMGSGDNSKLDSLRIVQEIIIHKVKIYCYDSPVLEKNCNPRYLE
jgi:hypothetical protein